VGEGEREGHRSILAGACPRISREPTASNRIIIIIITIIRLSATSRASLRAPTAETARHCVELKNHSLFSDAPTTISHTTY
jgi:hypothetical protein